MRLFKGSRVGELDDLAQYQLLVWSAGCGSAHQIISVICVGRTSTRRWAVRLVIGWTPSGTILAPARLQEEEDNGKHAWNVVALAILRFPSRGCCPNVTKNIPLNLPTQLALLHPHGYI